MTCILKCSDGRRNSKWISSVADEVITKMPGTWDVLEKPLVEAC